MQKDLTLSDIDEKIREKIRTENYSQKETIDGIRLIDLPTFLSEEGDFGEIARFYDNNEVHGIPGFKALQINRTRLNPGSIKAWHLHFKQDEIWYLIPSGHLFIGLWDVRKESKTKGNTMRIVLGEGKSQLLLIPRGVAHGSANFIERSVELFYFVNRWFDPKKPDELRINWDALGKEFWFPVRG